MNRSQLLDPEQQKKGVGGREDNISGEIKGKDGSVTTHNPIHPHDEEQRIKGSVLGGDNIGRESRDREPVPTTAKMRTKSAPIHASSPFDLDQQQKPKGADLRQEEDHKRNSMDPSKEQQINDFLGRQNSTDKNDDVTSNSLHSSDTNYMVPVGIPITENGGDREGLPPPVNLAVVIRPQTSDESKKDPSKEQQINNFLGRENSTDKNDDAISNSLLYSSDTNIPVGIPIAENIGDKGQQQIGAHHVHVKVSVESEKVTTLTITVNGKQNDSDEQHKPVDEQNRIQKAEENERMTRNPPQYPNPDQNKNNKINNDEPRCCERCKNYCSKLYRKIRSACGCDAAVAGDK